MDDIPNFVHCSVLRNGNQTFHQESWGGPSKFFGGPDLPPLTWTPQWLRPCKRASIGVQSYPEISLVTLRKFANPRNCACCGAVNTGHINAARKKYSTVQ